MDRSFLSNADVVHATRDFVCIRLATYEDAEEAEYLRKIFQRNGDLENTVFAILSADGSKPLARTGRGPRFRRPEQMAGELKSIVNESYSHAPLLRWKNSVLPETKNLELGLNVAACDGLPCVVIVGETHEQRSRARESLLPLAWSEEFAGKAVFASANSKTNLKAMLGLESKGASGVYVVAPGAFGLQGEVFAKLRPETLVTDYRNALQQFQPVPKSHQQHVQAGFQLGLRWETAIPVTDQQALNAANRLWGNE